MINLGSPFIDFPWSSQSSARLRWLWPPLESKCNQFCYWLPCHSSICNSLAGIKWTSWELCPSHLSYDSCSSLLLEGLSRENQFSTAPLIGIGKNLISYTLQLANPFLDKDNQSRKLLTKESKAAFAWGELFSQDIDGTEIAITEVSCHSWSCHSNSVPEIALRLKLPPKWVAFFRILPLWRKPEIATLVKTWNLAISCFG